MGGKERGIGGGVGPLSTRKKDQSPAVFIITITDVYDSLRAGERSGGILPSPFLPANPFNTAVLFFCFFKKAGTCEDVNQRSDEARRRVCWRVAVWALIRFTLESRH